MRLFAYLAIYAAAQKGEKNATKKVASDKTIDLRGTF